MASFVAIWERLGRLSGSLPATLPIVLVQCKMSPCHCDTFFYWTIMVEESVKPELPLGCILYTTHSMYNISILDGCFFADRSLAPTWERLWMRATRQELWFFGSQNQHSSLAVISFPWRPRDSVSWHFVSLLAFLWGPSWVESDLAGKLGVGKGWHKGWEDCWKTTSYFVRNSGSILAPE